MFVFLVAPIALCQQVSTVGADAAKSPHVELLRAGRSPYCIVLEPSASPSEKHAAEELQTHFKACTDVELPIVTGKPEAGMPMIVLGRGPIAAGLGVAPSDESLGPQGFILRTAHAALGHRRHAGSRHSVWSASPP